MELKLATKAGRKKSEENNIYGYAVPQLAIFSKKCEKLFPDFFAKSFLAKVVHSLEKTLTQSRCAETKIF